MRDKNKIMAEQQHFVKCKAFERIGFVETSKIFDELWEFIIKNKLNEYTSNETFIIFGAIYDAINELPINESQFEELNNKYNCAVEKEEI